MADDKGLWGDLSDMFKSGLREGSAARPEASGRKDGAPSEAVVYPDAVLQDKARNLALLQQNHAWRIEEELDARRERLSVQLWLEIQYFTLYIINKCIQGSAQLHPDSRSHLALLFIEAWLTLKEQTAPPPTASIFARAAIALMGVSGLGTKWDREGFERLRAAYDAFLLSEYRNTHLRAASDRLALAFLFIQRIKDGRTYAGSPLSFGFTKDENLRLAGHILDCFTESAQIL